MIVYRGRLPKAVMEALLNPDGPAGDRLVKVAAHVRHGDEDYGEPGCNYFEEPAFMALLAVNLVVGTYDGNHFLVLPPDLYIGYRLVTTTMMTTESGRFVERSL